MAAQRTGVLVSLLVLAFACGCAPANPPARGAAVPAPSTSAATAPSAGAGAEVAPGLNVTDLAWLQLMTAMNKRALSMLDDAPGRLASPRLARLATELRAGHRVELAKFTDILGPAGTAVENPHEGHNMPGMASPDVLKIMSTLDDAAFDRLLVRHLRAHLTQSAHVSRSERSAGADPEAKALAADIERTRTRQLAQLDAAIG